jgi:DNA-binding CsgD family transcriptional regulator
MLERVAQQATSRGAHAIASAAHERAAALSMGPDRVTRRLTAAGEAAWLAGMRDQAMGLLDRALAAQPDALMRAHAEEVRAAVEARSGSLDTALARLLAAADAVRGTSPEAALRLLADAVHVSFYLADPAAARNAATTIEQLIPACTDPQAVLLGSMAVGMALVLSGAGAEGMDRLREPAYELAAHPEDADDRFRLPLRLQGALWIRDSGPLREVVARAIDRLREEAALGALPYLLMQVARDAATSDRWDDAESSYVEAVRLARETGQTTDLAVSLAGLACVHARQGRSEDCTSAAVAALEISEANNVRLATMWAELALGDLASATGDVREAVRHYEALESLLEARRFADPDQSCAPELVEARMRLGRKQDAAALAHRFSEQALAKGQPWSLARAERALALCSDGAHADAHYEAALELHAKTPDLYETARTELAYGAHLRRARRRVEARPVLCSALARFEHLNAKPWADRAAQELQATGETVRRREPGGVEHLTPQERQIAQLLAQGRTTREAAAALFLSPKTVEYHLRHVYLKLGIRSRDALAERLAPGSEPDGASPPR